MNKVSVIIPNYNGMKFVNDCMVSLQKQNYKAFDIIIIDNYSTDGSYEYLVDNYPEAIIKRMDKNYGFSIAVNEGIKMSETEYVLLLNNDTEVDPNFVGELVKAIEKDDKIFAVSSKMISYWDRKVMDDAGDLYNLFGWAFQKGVGRSINEYNKKSNVFTACAGAAIYRKKVFEKIGYFDEKHFAYLEDIDISYRANLAGYTLFYEPSAVCHHVGSGTSGSKYNSFKVHLSARNSIYLLYKNMPFWMLLLNALPLVLGYLVKFLFFLKKGFGRDYLRGLRDGFSTRHTLKKVNEKEVPFSRYLRIECRFIAATFFYIRQRAEKRRAAAHD
jgi:GT2 family glycosyltransferase